MKSLRNPDDSGNERETVRMDSEQCECNGDKARYLTVWLQFSEFLWSNHSQIANVILPPSVIKILEPWNLRVVHCNYHL